MVGARARYAQQVAGRPVPVALIVDGGGQAPGRARTRRTASAAAPSPAPLRVAPSGHTRSANRGRPMTPTLGRTRPEAAQTPFLLRDDLVPSFPAQLTLGRAVPPPTCTLS